MSKHRILETERLILRPLAMEDYGAILAFMGAREVTQFLLFFSYPLNEPQLENWLRDVINASPDSFAYWGMIHRGTNRLMGILSLTIDRFHRKAEMGYWIGRDFWGQGLTPEAALAAIDYAFNGLKLHRLELTIHVKNKASQRVAKKLGFQLEGCFRESHFKDGAYWDVNFYGLLPIDVQRLKKGAVR